MARLAAPAQAQPRRDVRVRLLGSFAVTVDGGEIADEAWPSLRAAQLVHLLALADGHRLPREQVIDALWPQLDPDAGAANLRKAAHHARQAMRSTDTVALHGGRSRWPLGTRSRSTQRASSSWPPPRWLATTPPPAPTRPAPTAATCCPAHRTKPGPTPRERGFTSDTSRSCVPARSGNGWPRPTPPTSPRTAN
jgi:hypothetical protein